VQQYSITGGSAQNVLLARKGNAIRALVLVARTAAGARVDGFPDPFALRWDGTVIRQGDSPLVINHEEWEARLGAGAPTPQTQLTGVLALPKNTALSGIDVQGSQENYGLGAFWGTVQSSTLEFAGTWGGTVATLEVLTNDVQFVSLEGNPWALGAGSYLQAPAQPSARP
jgi:hypothetical protein